MSRFTIIIDKQNCFLCLIPNKKYKTPFKTDVTGVGIISKGPGFRNYYIDKIIEGSPSENSGLHIGDELLRVNGKECRNIYLPDLREVLTNVGKSYSFEIRRGRQVKNILIRGIDYLK